MAEVVRWVVEGELFTAYVGDRSAIHGEVQVVHKLDFLWVLSGAEVHFHRHVEARIAALGHLVRWLLYHSLGLGKAFVQEEDDLVDKVLDVAALGSPHEHRPIVGETLGCRTRSQHGPMTQFQLHLDGLRG